MRRRLTGEPRLETHTEEDRGSSTLFLGKTAGGLFTKRIGSGCLRSSSKCQHPIEGYQRDRNCRIATHSRSRSYPSYRCRQTGQGRVRRKPCCGACSRRTSNKQDDMISALVIVGMLGSRLHNSRILPRSSGRWSCRCIHPTWSKRQIDTEEPPSRRRS